MDHKKLLYQRTINFLGKILLDFLRTAKMPVKYAKIPYEKKKLMHEAS